MFVKLYEKKEKKKPPTIPGTYSKNHSSAACYKLSSNLSRKTQECQIHSIVYRVLRGGLVWSDSLSDAEIFGVLFVGLPPGLGKCVVGFAIIGLEFAVVIF